MDDSENITDGEIVEGQQENVILGSEATTESNGEDSGQAAIQQVGTRMTDDAQDGGSILINMEAMIKSHISSIDKLREELNKHSSMLKDIFENDETYKKHSEAAKEASRIKTATKNQILKQPQAADLNEKVKSLKSQLHELEDGLTDYLREYQRMSGVSEIEDEDGEIREIVFVPKLVKKSSIYQ